MFTGLNRKIRSLETETFKLLPNDRTKIKGLPNIEVSAIPVGEIKLIRIVNTALHVTVEFAVIKEIEVPRRDSPEEGLDLGIHSLAALSDFTPFEVRYRDNAKIESIQRDLTVNTRNGNPGEHNKPECRGSNAYRVTKCNLATEHERLRIREPNEFDRISLELVTAYPDIAVGDVQILNLVKNKRLSRRILEIGAGLLKHLLICTSIETWGSSS